jgi:hypothetical protein
MVRNSTCEEFVRLREYLTSIIPSNSVDAPRFPPLKNDRKQLAGERAHLQQLLIATGGTNGDRHQDEQKNVHNVHAGLQPTGHGPQIWED